MDALPRVLTEDVIDAGEAAKLLRVDAATVRRWMQAGRLEAVRAGAAWRTSRQAVGRFVAPPAVANTVPSPARLKRKGDRARAELERILARR